MSDQPPPSDGPAPQPTGDTVGDVAGRLGEHVGRFAALTMRRLQEMASVGVAMAGQTMAGERGADQHESAAAGEIDPDEPAPESATARAEALVDGAGAQMGALATLASYHLRRAAALAREEAEDLWAEAQQIRAAQRHDPE